MGHLAERYRDARRSGLYRASDAAVPCAAAGEAGALLVRIDAAACGLAHAEFPEGDAVVVLVAGLDDLLETDPATYRAMRARLDAWAGARAAAGNAAFAVAVDPRKVLDLPPLYREEKALAPARAAAR